MPLSRFTCRCLFALCIAFWQVAVPVLAYAHMARHGTLTMQVCSATGVKQVVVVDFKLPAGIDDTAATGDRHDCCPCGIVPPPLSGALPGLTAIDSGAAGLRVGHTFFQAGPARLSPPATGPPA